MAARDLVVDTMVLAYALLGFTDLHEESTAVLRAADEVLAPELLRAELTSALWQWTRARRVSADVALTLLRDGEGLVNTFVPTVELRDVAWRLAVERDHSPYDTLFVALAALYQLPLVTYDTKILQKFPEWAVSASDFLAGGAPSPLS